IDRAIVKEPAYKGKPKYCLLVLGPEAKTRAWLVLDGDLVYIDRNGNGDLTEPDEKVAWKGNLKTMDLGSIHGRDGKARCSVSLRKFPASVRLTVSDGGKQRYMVGDPDSDPLVLPIGLRTRLVCERQEQGAEQRTSRPRLLRSPDVTSVPGRGRRRTDTLTG